MACMDYNSLTCAGSPYADPSKQALEGELQAAEAARSKAIAAGAAAVADRDAAQHAIADAEQARAAQQEKLQAAQAAAATADKLRSKLAVAEQTGAQLSAEVKCLRDELWAARERASGLQQQLDAACDQLLQADREHQEKLAESAAVAERVRSEAEAEAERLRSEAQRLRQGAEALQQEKTRLAGRAEQLQQELDAERRRGLWSRLFSKGSKHPAGRPARPGQPRAGGAKVSPLVQLQEPAPGRSGWAGAMLNVPAAGASPVHADSSWAAPAATNNSTDPWARGAQAAGDSQRAATDAAQHEQHGHGNGDTGPAAAPQASAAGISLQASGPAASADPSSGPASSSSGSEDNLDRLIRELVEESTAPTSSALPSRHGALSTAVPPADSLSPSA